MRVVEMVLTGQGGPEALVRRERELPPPAAGQALVEVEATGVAFSEVQMLRGRYFGQPKFPFVPGYDLIGRVLAVGEGVPAGLLGARVAAMPRTGAWGSHVLLAADALVPVPADLPAEQAVAVVTNGVTAFEMAHRVARIRAGQTVLVHGAGGGVGGLLAQLAVRAGARVLGTASAGKHEALRALGVEPIDYRGEDVPARVRELAPDGVDAVFDHLGAASLRQSWALLARGGVAISYGSAATLGDTGHRLKPFLPTIGLLLGWGALRLLGLSRGRRAAMYYVRPGQAFRESLAEVLRLVRGGKLDARVAERLPMDQAGEALRKLTAGGVNGKIVLTP